MKFKKCVALLSAVLLLSALTGCAIEETPGTAEAQVENRLDKVEDTIEDVLTPNQSNRTASAPPVEAHTAPAGSATTELTKEQAEAIALEYAGFGADQVSNLRTEYEIDDGTPQYDVEFYQGAQEYEFEIHAETGKILSFDKDER